MNRNFDYLWNYQDVSTTPKLGANSWTSAGPTAASEPEVQSVQNFLNTHPVCLPRGGLHTGEQSVLWPWCWSPAPTSDDSFMGAIAGRGDGGGLHGGHDRQGLLHDAVLQRLSHYG